VVQFEEKIPHYSGGEVFVTEGTGVVTTRQPEEAIVIIVDTTKYQREDTNTRLDAAKICFLLFAQKIQAYDYTHVFSLCTFEGTASGGFDFTENIDSFWTRYRD